MGIKRVFAQEEIDDILAMYQDGQSSVVISKKYSHYIGGITKLLKDNGIWIRQSRVFTDEQETIIGEQYLSGISTRKLATMYGVDKIAIAGALRRQGIEQRTPAERNRLYQINGTVFDVITAEAAYWLGFLYADGHVRKRSLYVGLSDKDRDHLQRLLDFCGSSAPIRDTTQRSNGIKYPSIIVCLTDDHMATRLFRLGITSYRKNFQSTIDNLPAEYSRDWIRGLFDGDGSISVDGKHRWHLSICCHLDTATWVADTINAAFPEKQPAKVRKHCRGEDIYYVHCSGRINVAMIYEYLYDGCTIAMDRKRDKMAKSLIAPAGAQRDKTTGRYLPEK